MAYVDAAAGSHNIEEDKGRVRGLLGPVGRVAASDELVGVRVDGGG